MRPLSPGIATLHLWSLSEDVVLHRTARDDRLILSSPWGVNRLERPGPLVLEALRRMELGPVLLANALPGHPDDRPKDDTPAILVPVLTGLSHLIVRTLGVDDLGGPLLSVFPVEPAARFTLVRLTGGKPMRLPDTAVLTSLPSGFSLEATTSAHRVVLHRPEAAMVVALLAWPVTHEAASAALPLPPQVTEAVLCYLAAAGMAVWADG
ncbi:NADH oxidase [Streptomyces sp. NPDC006645]|uniref:NADH oxidase n=1 Tax=unclassified Streptomyces TaxID=2593676 RepID=UPI0033A3DC5A